MTAQEVLQSMMEGNDVTEAIFNELLNDRSIESQHLEFKDGMYTHKSERRAGRKMIREYVSGFANSSGGLLILGVADDKTISPCKDPIGQIPLIQWASRLFQDMAPYLSPLPKLQVLNHSDGLVLVIACPRSTALVPCVEAGELRYHLRIGDSTIRAPEYLISDLVLGHRKQPVIEASLDRKKSRCELDGHVMLVFEVENLSFVTANSVRLGVVAYYSERKMNPRPVNGFLRSFVELGFPDRKPGLMVTRTPDMLHETPPQDILPFYSKTIHLMPIHPVESDYEDANIGVGVFLSSENGPTIWYQLSFDSNIANLWKFARVDYGRPYIGKIPK